jgi:hypothetical protein
VSTDVSEEHIASIFREEEISSASKQNNPPGGNPGLYREQKVNEDWN